MIGRAELETALERVNVASDIAGDGDDEIALGEWFMTQGFEEGAARDFVEVASRGLDAGKDEAVFMLIGIAVGFTAATLYGGIE